MKIRDKNNTTIVTGVGATAGAFNFQLSADTGNSATYAALFDQYRVVAWDAVFRPKQSVTFDGVSTAFSQPLYVVIDFDDSTALASVAVATEYETCVQLEAYQSCRRSFIPLVNVPGFGAGAFASSIGVESPWIDMAYPSVEHYGLKWYSPAQSASFIPVWELEFTYTVQFRSTR